MLKLTYATLGPLGMMLNELDYPVAAARVHLHALYPDNCDEADSLDDVIDDLETIISQAHITLETARRLRDGLANGTVAAATWNESEMRWM